MSLRLFGMKQKITWSLAAMISLATLVETACGPAKKKESGDSDSPIATTPEPVEVPLELSREDRAWWLQKANQVLRLGRPLREMPGENLLVDMPARNAALKLMDDKAFYDLVTDFSMYWFGTKVGALFAPLTEFRDGGIFPIKDPSGKLVPGINSTVNKTPQAVFAALSLAEGKDYFQSLFAAEGPLPTSDLGYPYCNYINADGSYGFLDMPAREMRLEIAKRVKDFAAKIQVGESYTKEKLCSEYKADVGDYCSLGTFNPAPQSDKDSQFISGDVYRNEFYSWCRNVAQTDPAYGVQLMIGAAAGIAKSAEIFTRIVDTLPSGRFDAVSSVQDLKRDSYKDFGIQSDGPQQLWNSELFGSLQNSSTNRNRKRASWILKRFFCDDLTPINVEAPTETHADVHGSNPSCYSCHYKLDPMAGYFRELGSRGRSFANQPKIRFDDQAEQDRSTYEQLWKADGATGREWNIGYVRSTTDSSQNTYGANFSDLLNLLKTAPEVKECFVRRVFEYVVGEEQTFDRAWARGVVSRMNDTAMVSSREAIRGVFAEVVTSRAFLAKERNNNICYDMPDGIAAKNRAPCRIASILERNCNSCHSAMSAQGGLDLATWKISADGEAGFIHTKGGVQVATKATFKMMIERLNDSDSSRRMPLMKSMPAAERQELFQWLQKSL
ncbi:MAG: DUF1588 domain-containing protein [Proteobacteria bacterium]|nr:DUF1588 domain-containing protein [Pseudomonadota bacterium]